MAIQSLPLNQRRLYASRDNALLLKSDDVTNQCLCPVNCNCAGRQSTRLVVRSCDRCKCGTSWSLRPHEAKASVTGSQLIASMARASCYRDATVIQRMCLGRDNIRFDPTEYKKERLPWSLIMCHPNSSASLHVETSASDTQYLQINTIT